MILDREEIDALAKVMRVGGRSPAARLKLRRKGGQVQYKHYRGKHWWYLQKGRS